MGSGDGRSCRRPSRPDSPRESAAWRPMAPSRSPSLRLFTDSMTSHDQVRNELAEPVRVFEELGRRSRTGPRARPRRAAPLLGGRGSRRDRGARASSTARPQRRRPPAGDPEPRLCLARGNARPHTGRVGPGAMRADARPGGGRSQARGDDHEVPGPPRGDARQLRPRTGADRGSDGARGRARPGGGRRRRSVRGRAEIELLAGRPAAAERALRPAVEVLERMGDQGHFVTMAPVLADALLALGRDDEAAPLIELVAEWAMADDIDPQIGWRRVQAKLLAHQRRLRERRAPRTRSGRAGRADRLPRRPRTRARGSRRGPPPRRTPAGGAGRARARDPSPRAEGQRRLGGQDAGAAREPGRRAAPTQPG